MPRPKNPLNSHPRRLMNRGQHPIDHRRWRTRDAVVGVPATVWAPPPSAVGPSWERWVHRTIQAAFLPPAGRMLDLTDHATGPTHPAPVAHPEQAQDDGGQPVRPVRVAPFWVHLVDTAPEHRAATTTLECNVNASRSTASRRGEEVLTGERVDLVFVDLRDGDVDDRVGMLGWMTLRRGGVLAVLTRCHSPRSSTSAADPAAGVVGELVDPTGQIVASAQNADLLYLQHIVIPTRPLRPAENAPANGTAATPANDANDGERQPQLDTPAQRVAGHGVAHVDLLVFLSPRAQPSEPSDSASPPANSMASAAASGSGSERGVR